MLFKKTVLTATALVLSLTSRAQSPQPPVSTPLAKPSSDATLNAPTTPTSEQIERMRTMLADWPNLARYRSDNEALAPAPTGEKRVVFLGDSITDRWGRKVGTFFPGKPYINRGISGQTTPQMLLRFQQDVIHLHPAVVVLLGVTNDIARNTGPSSPAMIEDNIASMATLARANEIRLVIASVLPAARYRWRPEVNGVSDIREVNAWIKRFCEKQHLVYLDYYSTMADEVGGMKPGLSSDEVHPTEAGYGVMAPLAEATIRESLNNLN